MKADGAKTISVATYNIHRCVGTDGRKDPDRIARVLHDLECDIVGLQEVESHGPPGSNAHQLDFLARQGDYRSVAGPTMEHDHGHYGNALLTTARVVDVARYAFDVSTRWEPRGVLVVCLEIRGYLVRTIVTHLGLHPAERRDQVTTILDIVGHDENLPTLLVGDFNEWIPWARSRRRLKERFGAIPMPATFPSKWPLFALDHIWIQPLKSFESLESVRTPLTRVASDHLPLRAVVCLDEAADR